MLPGITSCTHPPPHRQINIYKIPKGCHGRNEDIIMCTQ